MKAKTIAGVLASVKGVVAVLAFFGIVSTASAEVVFVTYKGTVSVGYDRTGIFGPPNSSLDGEKYTASYIFDTSVGVIQNSPSYSSVTIGPVLGAGRLLGSF
jgi:hypothetical protein